MRFPILGLAVVLTIASISVMAWSQVTAPENPKTPWQEVVVAVTDQPDEHFQKAREDFLKGDKKDAAMEIGRLRSSSNWMPVMLQERKRPPF